MPAKESALGLKKIEIADVVASGLPSVWTELEDVKIGTASLVETEASTQNIFIEQSMDVYRNIVTEPGVTTLAFELYDVSPANLALLKGGTASAASSSANSKWKKGDTISMQKAVKVTTLDDQVITLPNGSLIANINWVLTKGDLATIAVTVTAQKPLDSTLSAIEIEANDKLPA